MKFVLKTLKNSISVTSIANVHFFEFPEDFYTEQDSHPFYELVYVSSGKLMVDSQDYVGHLDKNFMLIHRANELHSLKTLGSNAPTVIIIGFSCDSDTLDYFSKNPVYLDDGDVKKLAEIIKEGRNVFAPPYNVPKFDMKKKKDPPFGAEQLLKNLLEYFLISIVRKFHGLSTNEENFAFDKVSAKEIIDYINDNYKEKITIDELAFIFRTNRSTLCKTFKENTGKTITEFVNEKKLLKAQEKILTTNKTMTEIAEGLNFESIHYFTRFFKKMTGISPNEYRKQNKKTTL